MAVRRRSGCTALMAGAASACGASAAVMVIVFNPVAGRRRASLLWRVLDVLVANGVRLDLAETSRPGHAEALAREAVNRGETMVVAAGGDGTIAEVANGLMGSSVRLGIIPLGTANVLAHELGLPFAPRAVAAALAFGRTRLLWPGLARGESVGPPIVAPAARSGTGDVCPPGGLASARAGACFAACANVSSLGPAAQEAEGKFGGMGKPAARLGPPSTVGKGPGPAAWPDPGLLAARDGSLAEPAHHVAADAGSSGAGPSLDAGRSSHGPATHGVHGGIGGAAAATHTPDTPGDACLLNAQRAGVQSSRATQPDTAPEPPEHGRNQRLFVQMLGVGFDAQVVHTLPVGLKRMFGKGAYVLQTLNTLYRYNYPSIRLQIDGTETTAASVVVSKGVLYGGRYRLAPDAKPEEPGFSVVLFDHAGPGAALLYGMALPLHLLQSGPGVRHVRAERVDFMGNQRMPAQADGDAAGFAPLSVVAAPAPIHVVAP